MRTERRPEFARAFVDSLYRAPLITTTLVGGVAVEQIINPPAAYAQDEAESCRITVIVENGENFQWSKILPCKSLSNTSIELSSSGVRIKEISSQDRAAVFAGLAIVSMGILWGVFYVYHKISELRKRNSQYNSSNP